MHIRAGIALSGKRSIMFCTMAIAVRYMEVNMAQGASGTGFTYRTLFFSVNEAPFTSASHIATSRWPSQHAYIVAVMLTCAQISYVSGTFESQHLVILWWQEMQYMLSREVHGDTFARLHIGSAQMVQFRIASTVPPHDGL